MLYPEQPYGIGALKNIYCQCAEATLEHNYLLQRLTGRVKMLHRTDGAHPSFLQSVIWVNKSGLSIIVVQKMKSILSNARKQTSTRDKIKLPSW